MFIAFMKKKKWKLFYFFFNGTRESGFSKAKPRAYTFITIFIYLAHENNLHIIFPSFIFIFTLNEYKKLCRDIRRVYPYIEWFSFFSLKMKSQEVFLYALCEPQFLYMRDFYFFIIHVVTFKRFNFFKF